MNKRNERRLARIERALGTTPTALSLNPDPQEFPAGRDCAICGHVVYNAFVIHRTEGEAQGLVHYVGPRCALSVFAWYTRGLKR